MNGKIACCLLLQKRMADHALVYRPTSKRRRELGEQLVEAVREGNAARVGEILDAARRELGKGE